jgi:hypothetical protein
MVLLLGIAIVVVLVYLPQWWVKKVFATHQVDRDDFPGTGGQLAEHVIETLQIKQASVQVTELTNHFDPASKTVALIPIYHRGKSLTAITVAAHEIGHLIQLEEGNTWLKLRTQLVQWTKKLERYGMIALFLIPIAGLLTRSPAVMIALTGLGLSGMLLNVVVHLVTLPMELDASFGKALPLLKTGEFISREDEPKVKQILWAAALTYLASALSSLLNLANWIRILRR